MKLCAMSSNGFLAGASLHSLPVISWRGHVCTASLHLEAGAPGEWAAWINRARQPVLLLRHRSCWGGRIAGLSLRTANGRIVSAWFLLSKNDHKNWRRMRVRYLFP
jgi:hypothetical protein